MSDMAWFETYLPGALAEADDAGSDADDWIGSEYVMRMAAYLAARLSAQPKEGLNGAALIAAERRRQIDGEGWTPDHDQMHAGTDDLAMAAVTYALPADRREEVIGMDGLPETWPWSVRWWKPVPTDRIRELVKAGALIAAQIDLLAAKPNPEGVSDE